MDKVVSQVSYSPEMGEKKKILVAMSGGVDSSTTAALLKNEGHEVIGVTMQLWDYANTTAGCCTLEDVSDARRVAEIIGIPHYVVNYMGVFKKYIIEDFIKKYSAGLTPNPCILCNQFVKFNFLLKRTMELGADFLATGHYASIKKSESDGRYYLTKAADSSKDQSYFLFPLTQRELSRLMFPLGMMSKEEVRAAACSFGLDVADKPDSQDICFVSGGDYRDFIKTYSDVESGEGEIVDMDGNVLGYHGGVYSFTVGQRRGLGISGNDKPLYVVKVEPKTNRVYVGGEEELYRTTLLAKDMVWATEPLKGHREVKARIRHRHTESEATVKTQPGNKAVVVFKKRQRAMTPGQAVVLYDGDMVLGGGWISEVQ